MDTLAAWIATEGKLAEEHAVGWIVRMAKALEPVHLIGKAHGRLSTKALLMDGSSCHEAGAIVSVEKLDDEVAYHSPERAIGAAPSAANDTWSAAVILYVAVTGSLPFVARTDEDLRMCFAGTPPRRLETFGLDSKRLQRALDRAFMLARESRLDSMVELRTELVAIYPASDWLGALTLGEDGVPSEAPPAPVVLDRERAAGEETEAAGDDDDEEEPETQMLDAHALGLEDVPRPAAAPTAAAPVLPKPQPPPPSRPPRKAPAAAPPQAHRAPDSQRAPAAPPRPRSTDRADSPAPSSARPPTESQRPARPAPPAAASAAPKAEPPPPPSRRNKPLALPTAEPAEPGSAVDLDGLRPRPPAEAPPAPTAAKPQVREAEPVIAGERSVSERVAEPFDAPLDPRAAFRDLVDTDPKGATAKSARQRAPVPPVDRGGEPAADRRPERRPPSAVAAAAAAAPTRKRRKRRRSSRLHRIVQAILILLIGAGVFFAVRPDMLRKVERWIEREVVARITGSTVTPPAPTAPTPSSALPTAANAAAGGPAPAGTDSSGAAAESPPAESAAAAGTNVTPSARAAAKPAATPAKLEACVASLFAPDAFAGTKADFEFLCTEDTPRKGAAALKSQVVLRGHQGVVTEAMREWALIGWFEIAAFVAARARCCAAPKPLVMPDTLAHCQLDPALDRIASSVKGSDDGELASALDDYFSAMQCLFRVGAGSVFGMLRPSTAGSRAAFDKMLTRMRTAPQ